MSEAEAIRRFRKRTGLTQAEAAKWYGVDTRTWQRYEAGVSVPKPLLKRIEAVKRGRSRKDSGKYRG